MILDQKKFLRNHVIQLKASATLAINEKSAQLQAEGKEVYRLGFGQSPFPVPDEVIQALKDHAHEKDYLPVKGLPVLRKAIADWINQRTGLAYRPEDVLVSPGSKELLFLTQMAFKGDLILPSPSWVSYHPQAQITAHKVYWIETTEDQAYLIQPGDLAALCKPLPKKPRVLLLNYPGNPAGTSYSPEQLREISKIAREHHLIVLSDEIYGEVHHTGEHASMAAYYPEGTIISTGISKWCGAGGWRLGTFIFPESLHPLRDAMATVASETYTSTSAPIQYAAAKAFQEGKKIQSYVVHSRQILQYIAAFVHRRLSKMGITAPAPEGGFYLFINFENHRQAMAKRNIQDSFTLCERLLEEAGVALLPGVDFGRRPEELTARLSYVDFDGGAAIEALKNGAPLDSDWLDKYAGKIVKAMEVLNNWLDKQHEL